MVASRIVPKPYESAGGLSVTVQLMLGMAILLALTGTAVDAWGSSFLDNALAGVNVTKEQGTLIDSAQNLVAVMESLAYIVTGITFMIWFKRVRQNVEAFGVIGLGSKPHDCIWGFIIPIVALYKPLTVAQEIWKSCSIETSETTAWKKTKGSFLIGFWWFFWLIHSATNQLLNMASKSIKADKVDFNQLSSLYNTMQLAESISVITALLAIFVVRKLTVRQQQKYAAFVAAHSTAADIPSPGLNIKGPDNAIYAAPVLENIHSDTKTCPFCAEEIKQIAILCRFCGSKLPEESTEAEQLLRPNLKSETAPDGLLSSVMELPHFPFADFSSFQKAALSQEIGVIVRQDGALQWAAGGSVAEPPYSVAAIYRVCRFIGGGFPSALVLFIYSIATSHWWLLLSLPLCWVAAFLFDPIMGRAAGILYSLPLLATFMVLGWSFFNGQPMWSVLAGCLLVIWLALKMRLMVVVPAFHQLVLHDEKFLCLAWQASWLTISIPSEQAEYNINYEKTNGKTQATAHMMQRFKQPQQE